ncbi:TetR family transcriptional regulator [Ureibacillus xyleni]|uniref:TetR family transcriptional regulator n=1 Tax=Ureibacillus xyleni TaxID=614648 RepID=A0A285TP31_9BACL|nr:TetR/AcrR family transcriptional regulator [Ureibacillus xyleni]SOC24638.1 TetR family transcriptional regulator [Ureibacillus xyleni]
MNEKESTKDKIIKTASRLFQMQGYHATGLNQIIKESGSPKGSLYYYFPDGKEQLALESLQVTAKFVLDQIVDGLQKSSEPVMAIQNLINDMAERFEKEGCKGGVPVASIALETSLISEPLRNACQLAYFSFQDAFTQKLISSGLEENRAIELGIAINSMVEGAFLLSFTMGNSQPLRMVAKQIPVLLK